MLKRGEKSVSLDPLIHLSQILILSIDYLLFGNSPHVPKNFLTDVLNSLSQQQREDTLKILQMYAKAGKE